MTEGAATEDYGGKKDTNCKRRFPVLQTPPFESAPQGRERQSSDEAHFLEAICQRFFGNGRRRFPFNRIHGQRFSNFARRLQEIGDTIRFFLRQSVFSQTCRGHINFRQAGSFRDFSPGGLFSFLGIQNSCGHFSFGHDSAPFDGASLRQIRYDATFGSPRITASLGLLLSRKILFSLLTEELRRTGPIQAFPHTRPVFGFRHWDRSPQLEPKKRAESFWPLLADIAAFSSERCVL